MATLSQRANSTYVTAVRLYRLVPVPDHLEEVAGWLAGLLARSPHAAGYLCWLSGYPLCLPSFPSAALLPLHAGTALQLLGSSGLHSVANGSSARDVTASVGCQKLPILQYVVCHCSLVRPLHGEFITS